VILISLFAIFLLLNGGSKPIHSVETDKNVLAITFDAAWGAENTEYLLNILSEKNVKATFFLCGYWVKNYPDLVKKIHGSGHDIANHGNTHINCSDISKEQVQEEILGTHEKVYDLIGMEMDLFRPPYGAYNSVLMEMAKELGYHVVKWNVDSFDWMNKGVQFETDHVLNNKNLQNGAIILFHNGAKDTLEALPAIIEGLRAKGYEFVSVSELIIRENYTVDEMGRQRAI